MSAPEVDFEPRYGMKAAVLRAGGAVAEVLPERGGLVSRWSVGGDEVLFLDPKTVEDRSKNVRGGIPLLFPIAGRVKGPLKVHGKPVTLEQHGFARKRAFAVTEASADDASARLAYELDADEETKKVFGFDFHFHVVVTLDEKRLTLELSVGNEGEEPFPLHLGLHPYFRVPLETKAKARVSAQATKAFDLVTDAPVPYSPPRFDGPEVNLHLLDAGPTATLDRGDGRKVQLDSSGMSALVLWTLPNQPFVCVEPWSDPVDTFGQRMLGAGHRASFACSMTLY